MQTDNPSLYFPLHGSALLCLHTREQFNDRDKGEEVGGEVNGEEDSDGEVRDHSQLQHISSGQVFPSGVDVDEVEHEDSDVIDFQDVDGNVVESC